MRDVQPTFRNIGLTLILVGLPVYAQSPTLAILDPVDVATGRVMPMYGDLLRAKLLGTGKFGPLTRQAMEKKLKEFNWEADKPCHEFQCGFDAGNILLSEYVLFGSVTALDGIYAYTLNLLHVPSSQVIASEAGDVSRNPFRGGDDPLNARLTAFISQLDPAHLEKSRVASRGLMAVLDLNAGSPESRVLAERVGTHVYASRKYDLMSQMELQELLTAMSISISGISPNDSGMIALGTRLNVAYLVQSKLTQDADGRRLDLALFDVAGKRRIRDWSSKPTREFQGILQLENRFFTTLTEKNGLKTSQPSSHWQTTLLSLIGIAAATGLATLAYTAHQDANGDYGRAEAAYSLESGQVWKKQAKDKDQRTVLFGSLAALSLGLSVTLWAF